MAGSTKTILTDRRTRTWVDRFELPGSDLGLTDGPTFLVRKRTLHDGLSAGVDIIEINNGAFSFTIVPTRGMGLWRGEYRGLPVGWHSPVRGPVHPSFISAQERGGLGWLRGFDETVVRCGLESNGAPCRDTILNNNGQPAEVDLTLHGSIANTPASYVAVEVTDEPQPRIIVTGTVCETGLFLPQLHLTTRISTSVHSNRVTIEDTVTNEKGIAGEMQLLYHCNFGAPFLEQDAHLEVPARLVAPRDERAAEGIDSYMRYLGPTHGYVEQCYWYETLGDTHGDTLALLRNAAEDRGVVLRFNRDQLPCFTQWKNTASEASGYVTGLEPGTNFPNPKPFERRQGRVVTLEPHQSYRCTLALEVADSAAAVQAAQAEIDLLQGDTERIVHRAPVAGYSDI